MRNVFVSIALMLVVASNANASSISFDSDTYPAVVGDLLSVTVNFDFTDNPAFGGGFNVIYDATALDFVSYTQAVFSGAGAPQVGNASPLGDLAAPGQYLGAGVGTFEFFTGINTAGPVGTFIFNVLNAGPGDAGCSATLCLTPVDTNPVFNLIGQDITNEAFAKGITAANIAVSPVPLPAAAWLFLTAMVGLFGAKKLRQA